MLTKLPPPTLSSLRRLEPTRGQRKAILIATEDTKSSRLYFESFAEHLKHHRVVFIPPHQGSSPSNVVDAAKEYRDAKNSLGEHGGGDRFDEIWVVFDTEGPQNAQRMRDARQAIDRALSLNFLTAVSNPTFEFWIILHYEKFEGPLASGKLALKKAQELVKKHDNYEYAKTKDVFYVLYPRVSEAVANAKKIFSTRYQHTTMHPCDCHPSTQIYRLVESLISED